MIRFLPSAHPDATHKVVFGSIHTGIRRCTVQVTAPDGITALDTTLAHRYLGGKYDSLTGKPLCTCPTCVTV